MGLSSAAGVPAEEARRALSEKTTSPIVRVFGDEPAERPPERPVVGVRDAERQVEDDDADGSGGTSACSLVCGSRAGAAAARTRATAPPDEHEAEIPVRRITARKPPMS